MAIQSGTFTVIHFKHIWFHGSWTQGARIDFYDYTAGKAAKLVVVEENKSGSNITWVFTLSPNDLVAVNYADSQVHVPRQPLRIAGLAREDGSPIAATVRRKAARKR